MDPYAMTSCAGNGTRMGASQMWKTNDAKANKTGPRHTVYWVRHNKKYATNKRLGLKNSEGKYSGGSRYTGDWRDNKRHGLGIFYYKNGAKYEGEWRSGLKHGHGKMVYANGDVYEGDWMDDQRAGLGVLTLANGDTYEGHWLADKKEGPGRYFYVSTRKMYEGEWVDDVAKCGVFSDIPIDAASEAGLPHPDDNIYKLPALTLKDPESVVVEAVEEVRFWRASQIAGADLARASLTAEDLTEDEIGQLRQAFATADPDDTGVITGADLPTALGVLGIVPTEEDMDALLADMNADLDSYISFDDFASCMA